MIAHQDDVGRQVQLGQRGAQRLLGGGALQDADPLAGEVLEHATGLLVRDTTPAPSR